MTSLSDTQRVLLSSAAQRDSGSLLPLPVSLRPGGGVAKAIGALLTRGFAEERETREAAAVRRTEGDIRYGIFVTVAGAAAIGIEAANDVGSAENEPVASPAREATPRTSKINAVVVLLSRSDGATLPELIEATDWLPHTTRAALTGLRKKGHEIARSKRDGATWCCQSNANRSLHDAFRPLTATFSSRAPATPPVRRSVVPGRSVDR